MRRSLATLGALGAAALVCTAMAAARKISASVIARGTTYNSPAPPPIANRPSPDYPAMPASSTGTMPMKVDYFLNSLGIVTKRTQGIDRVSQIESALKYSGIRNIRDDGTTNRALLSDYCAIHAATRAMVTLLPIVNVSTPNLSEYDALAACGALLQVEGANEPNNFPFSYKGQRCGGTVSTWAACAAFQRDLYRAVKADPKLAGIPVLNISEVGAESDNQGLQFLTIPSGAGTLQPAGAVYADAANLHNYVRGNPPNNVLGDNQAWGAEWPGASQGSWDGLDGEVINRTWRGHFTAYPISAGLGLRKETTETGWTTSGSGSITQDQQGKLFVNLYLSAAKLNWERTYIYELFDDQYGTWGIFTHNGSGVTPRLAGSYIHNLTSILSNASSNFTPTPLAYSVVGETSTIHDLLLQKSDGAYALAVWGDRPVSGTVTAVTVKLPRSYPRINVYDVTTGTTPIHTSSDASSVPLTITDHAFIVEFGNHETISRR